MGNHSTHGAAGRGAGLAQQPPALWGLCLALYIGIGPQLIQPATAQSTGEAPLPAPEPAAEAQAPTEALPPSAGQTTTARPARAQLAPLSDEAQETLTTRIEALEALAKGVLPAAPLDSLLGVSLDDDSSMIERDQEARLEQRRLMITLKQWERTGDKPEVELQQVRDQILALELERKVLALPMEVRERLVQESTAGSPEPATPAQPTPMPEPAPPKKDPISPEASEPLVKTQPAGATVQPTPPVADDRPWSSGWILFVALGALAFGATRIVRAAAHRKMGGIPDERREQSGAWAELGIYVATVIVALLLSLQLHTDLVALGLGALALLVVLGCKDVAASLVGGWFLFVQQPFRVGYHIDIGGVEGRVTAMGLLAVHVLGLQNRSIYIPNSEFLTKHVAASPPSGIVTPIQIDFYIHPRDDIADAKRIINEVIQSTRDADASKGRGGILVSQVPLNGVVMVRLRTKVFLTGAHAEQEIASELSERVLACLRASGTPSPPV